MPGPHFESLGNESDTLGRHGDDAFPQIDCIPLVPARATIQHNSDRNELAGIGVEQEEYESD